MMLLSIVYDFSTIFSINGDGTMTLSILCFICRLIKKTARYLPMIAMVLHIFLVGCVVKKLCSVRGVLIWFSWYILLGNGAKYHKSWIIIRFFAWLYLLIRIGIHPKYLIVLWYRMISGFWVLIWWYTLMLARILAIHKINPKYFTMVPRIPEGSFAPHKCTVYPSLSMIVFTSLIYVSIPPILLIKSDTIRIFLSSFPVSFWKLFFRYSFEYLRISSIFPGFSGNVFTRW